MCCAVDISTRRRQCRLTDTVAIWCDCLYKSYQSLWYDDTCHFIIQLKWVEGVLLCLHLMNLSPISPPCHTYYPDADKHIKANECLSPSAENDAVFWLDRERAPATSLWVGPWFIFSVTPSVNRGVFKEWQMETVNLLEENSCNMIGSHYWI